MGLELKLLLDLGMGKWLGLALGLVLSSVLVLVLVLLRQLWFTLGPLLILGLLLRQLPVWILLGLRLTCRLGLLLQLTLRVSRLGPM